jgi:crossover junction endodeoxyribonuclease RuvC
MAVAIPATAVRILGIDPGSRRTGVGVIDAGADGRLAHVFHCAIEVETESDNFSLRLKRIFEELGAIIARWQPHEAAIERVFMSKNADSALKLGQARGAAICALVACELEVAEYAPSEVKNALVGTGGADKTQVQHMVGTLLGLSGALQPDAADALAIAMTHAHTRSSIQRLGIPRAAWRRGR